MCKSRLRFLVVILFVAILACPLTGFTQDNEVEFDNQSGQIALVKLIGPTIREVNVPINSKHSVTALPGTYYILVRYGTSDNYKYTKGEKFEVTETTTQRSRTTITLHKVIGGNYDAKPISENEFAVSTPNISKSNNKSSSKEPTENSWVESTDVNFDGEVGFAQDTMGSMNDLIAKYKRGEKGVKIYANGKIVANSGKVLAVFNETPAKIVSIGDSEYYQFDEGDWRFRSSTNRFEKYRKIFHNEVSGKSVLGNQYGKVVGVLIEEKTGQPITDYLLKPFAQEKNEALGLWSEVLPNYKDVKPNDKGAFTLNNVPPGEYSLRAIVGESKVPGGGGLKVPVWSFMKDDFGNQLKFIVKPGQTLDLGHIKVKDE